MTTSIFSLQETLSDINHNIGVYERMHEYKITDEDRQKTLSDFQDMKADLEKSIEILTIK
jgi:hypothetical protein